MAETQEWVRSGMTDQDCLRALKIYAATKSYRAVRREFRVGHKKARAAVACGLQLTMFKVAESVALFARSVPVTEYTPLNVLGGSQLLQDAIKTYSQPRPDGCVTLGHLYCWFSTAPKPKDIMRLVGPANYFQGQKILGKWVPEVSAT